LKKRVLILRILNLAQAALKLLKRHLSLSKVPKAGALLPELAEGVEG